MSDDEQEIANLLSRERRKRLHLTDDEILVFYKAFKAIDENGDQRLQRSEIEEMLAQIGYEHNEGILDKLFQEASPEGRRKGLDLPEFLDLMSVEKSARSGSIGNVMRKNIEQVMTYSSLRARELAERNRIVHRRNDADESRMEQFIRSGLRCAQCRQMFDPEDNHDEACKYHPGPTSTHEAKENHLARVLFRCCSREQVGTNPALSKAKPCTNDWHRTREEIDAIFSGERPQTGYHRPGTSSLSAYAPEGHQGSSSYYRPPTSSHAPSSPPRSVAGSVAGSLAGSVAGSMAGGSVRSSLSRPMTHGEMRAANVGIREFNKDVVAWQYEEEHRQTLKTTKKDTPFDELVKTVAVAIYDKQIKLKKLFHKFDTNGNGTLEPPEFKAAIESVGYNLSTEQLMEMFTAFDIDGNGRIAFWEFVRSLGTTEDGTPFWGQESGGADLEDVDASLSNDDIVRKIQKKVAATGKSTAQVWRMFEQSFRHTMDPVLYSKAMAKLGLNMAPALCERLIKQYDQNGDGEQNEEEFNKMLESVETEEAMRKRLEAEAEARRRAEEEARRREEEERRRREEEERRRRQAELDAKEAALRAQQEEEARRRARPTVGEDAGDEEVLEAIVQALEAAGRPLSDATVLMDREGRGSVAGGGMAGAMDELGWNMSEARAARFCGAHSAQGDGRVQNPDLLAMLEATARRMHGPPRVVLDDKCSDEAIFRALLEKLDENGIPIPGVAPLVDPNGTGKMNGATLQQCLKDLGVDVSLGRCSELVKDYTMDPSGQHMPTKAFVQLLQAQAKKLGIGGRAAGGGGKPKQSDLDLAEEKRLFDAAGRELAQEKEMSREELMRRYKRENDMIQRLREELFEKSRMMKSMFERMDLDNSNSINYKEFQHGLERAGVQCSDADAMRMVARFDRDDNMRLDYNEFMRLLQNAKDIYVHDTGVKAVSELGGHHVAGRVWGADGVNRQQH